MKLKLNKRELIELSEDSKVLPKEMTPQVGGGYLSAVCLNTIPCHTGLVCGPGTGFCNTFEECGTVHTCQQH